MSVAATAAPRLGLDASMLPTDPATAAVEVGSAPGSRAPEGAGAAAPAAGARVLQSGARVLPATVDRWYGFWAEASEANARKGGTAARKAIESDTAWLKELLPCDDFDVVAMLKTKKEDSLPELPEGFINNVGEAFRSEGVDKDKARAIMTVVMRILASGTEDDKAEMFAKLAEVIDLEVVREVEKDRWVTRTKELATAFFLAQPPISTSALSVMAKLAQHDKIDGNAFIDSLVDQYATNRDNLGALVKNLLESDWVADTGRAQTLFDKLNSIDDKSVLHKKMPELLQKMDIDQAKGSEIFNLVAPLLEARTTEQKLAALRAVGVLLDKKALTQEAITPHLDKLSALSEEGDDTFKAAAAAVYGKAYSAAGGYTGAIGRWWAGPPATAAAEAAEAASGSGDEGSAEEADA